VIIKFRTNFPAAKNRNWEYEVLRKNKLKQRVWKFAAGRASVARPTTTKDLFKKLRNVEREEGGTEKRRKAYGWTASPQRRNKINFASENRAPIISRFTCETRQMFKQVLRGSVCGS
jgi:hypothetical protein